MNQAALELRVIMSELSRRSAMPVVAPESIQDPSFPEQNAFVLDTNRAVAAICTRRAGKSNGLALRFKRTMLKHAGCFCPYIALTRESARNIMWPVLQEQDEKFKIGAKFTESNLTMTMRNGSRLQLFGADMQNFIKRLKGIKTPGAAIDEAQDFGSHLEQLVDDVLGPATIDYTDGWLALTGTPGPVPVGYFYDITALKKYGYSLHSWSLFDNPYLPNPKEAVEELKLKKGWPDDHPTLLREYYGQWVMDLDALVVKYQAHTNHYDQLPHLGPGWSYIIGVDLGSNTPGNDRDAIAILGFHKETSTAYLVEEVLDLDAGISGLAGRLDRLIQTYKPDRIVIDQGGLGKKIADEMRIRYSLPIFAAEKARKFEFIELMNDALRTGKFMAKSSSRFADDSKRLKWDHEKSGPDKMVVSEHFHSDIIDATLYAFRECLHWLWEPKPEKIIPGTPKWMQAQEDEVIERLERQVTEDKEDPWSRAQGWDETN